MSVPVSKREKGNSFKLLQRMDIYLKTLWGEQSGNNNQKNEHT